MNMGLTKIREVFPPFFLQRLNEQFDSNTVDQILKGFMEDRFPVIRVNNLKTNVREIIQKLKDLNVRFERVSFLENALIILNKNEKFFEDLDIYKNGHIYFQGISSQLPVIFLDPKPNEKVLDMTAAPGSKTTQMAIAMQNIGEIVANEYDQIRFERLKYNLEKQGVKIAKVLQGDGCMLGDLYPEYFDKVLLDAPCSAEGRISVNNPRSYKFWSEKNIRNNARIQKKLIISAVKSLKKGGILVYSTCTLAPEENEMIVDGVLGEFKGILKTEKITLDFKYSLRVLTSFAGQNFNQNVKNAFKASPSPISEGFFIAKFRKNI